MKLPSLSIIATLLLFCFACKEKPAEDQRQTANIPKALENDNSGKITDAISYKRTSGMDLFTQLYDDTVSKNVELQQLEKQLSSYYSDVSDSMEVYHHYNDNSVGYYSAAIRNAEKLSDTLLKNKLLAIIKKSENAYISKTADIEALLNAKNKHETNLKDYHTVLKIAVTLPLIENYQQTKLPVVKATVTNIERRANQLKKKTQKMAESKNGL